MIDAPPLAPVNERKKTKSVKILHRLTARYAVQEKARKIFSMDALFLSPKFAKIIIDFLMEFWQTSHIGNVVRNSEKHF